MATQAYRTWVSAGKHWDAAWPIQELQTWARANGVPILGTIGNQDHLTADLPEDHTPFSATAWPVPLPGYVVTAIDLGNIRGLGQAIAAGARAGRYPWLKYMNHSGVHLDCRNGWRESPSGDEHVHLSIRSDWIARPVGAFDPWEGDVTPQELATWDGFTNPYGDAAKNPKITLDTVLRNVGGDARTVAQVLPAVASALARVEQKLEAATRQPLEIDYGKLAGEILRQLASR